MVNRVYATRGSSPNKKKIVILVLLLAVLCMTLGAFSVYRYFRVVNILCIEESHECSQATLDTLSVYEGRSMMQNMQPVLLGKKVEITKKYPQTIIAQVKNQEIFAHIYLDEAKQSQAVLYTDATVARQHDVPLSTSSGKVAITDLTLSSLADSTVLSQDRFSVYTELLEFSKATSIEEIRILRDDDIEIETSRQLIAVVSSKALKNQLHSLQLLLESPTIEFKSARVDLRFDRPVLQYY